MVEEPSLRLLEWDDHKHIEGSVWLLGRSTVAATMDKTLKLL